VFLDITASHEKRDLIFDLAARVAEEVFIPFTVGGGIKSVDDFRRILATGADKVASTAPPRDPDLDPRGRGAVRRAVRRGRH
jgi:cyclase